RLIENGFPYIVNGLGGENPIPLSSPVPGSVVRYDADNGAGLVDASDTSITFRFFARTGTLIDTYTMTKPASGLPAGFAPAGVTTQAATRLEVSVPDASTSRAPFSITVAALDADGNPATGYTGTIHFRSSDGQASLPADYTFTAADTGVHTFLAGV